MINPANGVLLIGAGNGHGELVEWLIQNKVNAVTLVEPQDAAFKQLETNISSLVSLENQNWTLHKEVVAEQPGLVDFYYTSKSAENGLISPELLNDIWPNLALVQKETLSATSLDTLNVNAAQTLNWLMIDCLGALKAIGQAQNLANVDVAIIKVLFNTKDTNTYSDYATILALFNAQGFDEKYRHSGLHPDIGYVVFVRNYQEQFKELNQNLSVITLAHEQTLNQLKAEQAAWQDKQQASDATNKHNAEAIQQQRESLRQEFKKMFTDQTQQLNKEVNSIKIHINNGLGNTAKQFEAFIGIQNYLERGIKPLSFHGWPISPDIGLYIAGLIDTNNYDVIIEFGSGTSTLLMAKALISKQRGVQTKTLSMDSQSKQTVMQKQTFNDLPARIITFEHNSLYHGKTLQLLKDNALEHLVDLVHAPLVDYQYKDGSQYLYYNCKEKLQELAEIFKGRKANILVLVDGPPGATNKNARFPALPHLLNVLPEHAFTIIMDDYNRAEEKEIVDIWKKISEGRHMNINIEEMKCEKGCATILINQKGK